MGFQMSVANLKDKYDLNPTDSASKAGALIDAFVDGYAGILDAQAEGGKARLLAAYARMAARQETWQLAQQCHTQTYRKNTLGRGRRQFLNYLDTVQHPTMHAHTVDDLLDKFNHDPKQHLPELTGFLSRITPYDAENYLSIYTSKNQSMRRAVIKVGDTGRKVSVCVGHAAACSARSAASSLWRDVDQTNKWSPLPDDPLRGTGCAFYHDRVTKVLMNKQKLDVREGCVNHQQLTQYSHSHSTLSSLACAHSNPMFSQSREAVCAAGLHRGPRRVYCANRHARGGLLQDPRRCPLHCHVRRWGCG